MKAGAAMRSAGYRVSYLDRVMMEDSIHTLTNRVAHWIFGTSNRQKGSRETGDEGFGSWDQARCDGNLCGS